MFSQASFRKFSQCPFLGGGGGGYPSQGGYNAGYGSGAPAGGYGQYQGGY